MARPPPGLNELLGLASPVLALLFWALIAAHHSGQLSGVIDQEYLTTGFCIAEVSTHGFDSYQLCFMIDTLTCLIALSMKHGKQHLGHTVTIFAHGCFHMLQYIYGWPLPGRIESVANIGFTIAFLGGFGIGSKVGSWILLPVMTAILDLFRRHYVPTPLTFAYVNAWIYVTATVVGVAESAQGHPRSSLLVTILVFGGVIVPFCEGILCNKGFKDAGGHALFDLMIAIPHLVRIATTKTMPPKAVGCKSE